MPRKRLPVAAGCMLVFLIACAREVPVFEPVDVPVSLVSRHLETKRAGFSSLRAGGTLQLEAGKQGLSGRVFLLCQMPRSLRVEVMSLLGQPLLYLVSDGEQLLSWIPGRRRAYGGPSSGDALASLVAIPLEDREALQLLAGVVPDWDGRVSGLFRDVPSGNLVLLSEGFGGRRMQRVWLEPEDLSVIRVERFEGMERRLDARFDDFTVVRDSLYPKHVVLESPEVRLSLRYHQLVVNEPAGRNAFHLELPAGIEVAPW
jgi:hypothetical protein